MKKSKSKALNTKITTISDFSSEELKYQRDTTQTTGTDPTNTTATSITTVNTGVIFKS